LSPNYSFGVPQRCERPGCREFASATYALNPAKRSITLDNFVEAESTSLNVLCKTHADRLKMPKDWLIDDRREANPRLFRMASNPDVQPSRDHTSARGHRRKSRPFPKPESFDTVPTPRPIEVPKVEPVVEPVVEPTAEHTVEPVIEEVSVEVDEVVSTVETPEPRPEPELEPTQAMPWKPRFDQDDDLDGVLKPKGRLLSRAFGSDETQFMQRPPKELQREPFDESP
jgi:hypothetical protein